MVFSTTVKESTVPVGLMAVVTKAIGRKHVEGSQQKHTEERVSPQQKFIGKRLLVTTALPRAAAQVVDGYTVFLR